MPKLNGSESDAVKIEAVKVKNFIKQFTFVTGKNLLIATTIVGLMSITLVFPSHMSINVFNYKLIESLNQISFTNSCLFLGLLLIAFMRICVLYLIIDFFILLLCSLGALFSFLKREYS